jgi:hypothetical protein
MATSFPSSIDSFTNPSASDALDSVSVPHAAQHANLNDAMVAVQTKLGTGSGTIGTWTTYTATTTNFTASSQSCAYSVLNDVVFIQYYFVVSSVTSYPTFTLPTGLNISFLPANQTGAFFDVGAGFYINLVRYASATSVYFTSMYSAGTYAGEGGVSSTAPFTWASGDDISGGFWYRTA